MAANVARLDTASVVSVVADGTSPPWAAARFDRVLYDGGEFGATPEDEDFIGLPGLLEPEQVALLLRERHADQLRKQRAAPGGRLTAVPPATASQQLTVLRKELNSLIAAWHHRTGQSHGAIHADLRRACGGPALPEATADQIRARIDLLRRWASGRS